jgi:hypothetical protein
MVVTVVIPELIIQLDVKHSVALHTVLWPSRLYIVYQSHTAHLIQYGLVHAQIYRTLQSGLDLSHNVPVFFSAR